MQLPDCPFKPDSIPESSIETDTVQTKATTCRLLHVETPSALIQAAGYIKYITAEREKRFVFSRGQDAIYQTFGPTLFRPSKDSTNLPSDQKGNRTQEIEEYLRKLSTPGVKKSQLRGVNTLAHEPLLQHYGLNTRWLDAVDNIWIALWFACNTAKASGSAKQYLHFEERITSASSQYAYIFLIKSAAGQTKDKPMGYYRDDDSVTIDLRMMVPSQYIRPHVQHGVVVQAINKSGKCESDFSNLIAAIIRINLCDALLWLGKGSLLSVRGLFPPPYYD